MHALRRTVLLLAVGGLALTGCSKKDEASSPDSAASASVQAAAPSSLPEALDNTYELQTVAEALKDTGMADVFKGKASYTLLAPEDDAFAALGDKGKTLTESEDDRIALAVLLKSHIIRGYVTPQAIGKAIDASKNGQVSLPNANGQALWFRRSGKALVVTAPDGSQARFDGDPVTGGSSLAIPVDGVLKRV